VKAKIAAQRKTICLGDVFELTLSNQKHAYVQYVFNYKISPGWGCLLKVYFKHRSTTPSPMQDYLKDSEFYYAFSPIQSAVRTGEVKIIDSIAVEEHIDYNHFPLFKSYNCNYATGAKSWYLWDGKNVTPVPDPDESFHELPVKECVTHTLLIQRIEACWHPRLLI
jgi:hypothetical protein